MKKLILLTALALAGTAGTGFAQYAGSYGFGVELTGTGSGATNGGVATLYAVDNGGGSDLTPVVNTGGGQNAVPSVSTSWTTLSTGLVPTFNLGTFSLTDTLVLNGGSYLTYKGSGGDVTGTTVFYGITSGVGQSASTSYGSYSLGFNENQLASSPNGSDNQRWSSDQAGVNLLSGLAPGTYTLSIYGQTFTNVGNPSDNVGGANYGATFTVVPEPGTWAMMLGGLGLLVAFQRCRRITS